MERCGWCLKDNLYMDYHDNEWGNPVWNDEKMFEFLVLETFQAGLSWYTILSKRENFRKAFDQFNAEKIANYNNKKIETLLQDAGIIRNKLKINGTVTNAKKYLEIKNSGKNFCDYIWQFVDGKTILNNHKNLSEVPATTKESDMMSKTLKKAGFAFVGSTVCYAHMQATGMVNDHLITCFKHPKNNI